MINGAVTDEPAIRDEMFADVSLHRPDGAYQSIFGLDVLPEYQHRGFGTEAVALMEAMCSRMPIVCTRIRGNTDLIDDGVSGVFSDNRPDALAEHIRRLYQNPELRASLGQEAAKKVMQFDEKAVQKQMREIYESIV